MKIFVCVFVLMLSVVSCKNILGLFPFGAKSHFIPINVFLKELANRGHNVTVVSPFEKENVRNYHHIGTGSLKPLIVDSMPVRAFDLIDNPFSFFKVLNFWLSEIENNGKLLSEPSIKSAVLNNTSFDVVLVELFFDNVCLLLAKKLNVPVIAYSSGYPLPWSLEQFGAPQNPSFSGSFFTSFNHHMNFYEKIMNTFIIASHLLIHKFILDPRSSSVFQKHLGPSDISVEDAARNVSLYILNTHFTFHSARPYPPQIVEVGGLHLEPAKILPQELDKWMNESSDGVIYFSFGSMLRGATLPADKVKAFLQVFKSLPQRVLWKWEDDAVETLPSNVKIMKWLPQRDILAHPKVKVFISHGGLLGTTEAVVSGVPILGIPMYGDQPNNVAALVENGVAIHIDYNNISVASLSYALNALIYDKRYSNNAKSLSQRFLDRPMSPLETAVYWTEYVIRHRGAPHLQSAAVHLAWYQYYLLDVIAVILAALLAVLSVIFYILKSCLRLVFSVKSTKLKTN